MNRSETIKILINSADTFADIAKSINYHGCLSQSHPMIIASSVNAALALEYLAKCLVLIHCDDYKKKHQIYKILEPLPLNVKDKLKKEYESLLTDEEKNRSKILSESSGVEIGHDFDSVINNWSSVFVHGRYWFEEKSNQTKSFHICFFEPLFGAFKKLIEEEMK